MKKQCEVTPLLGFFEKIYIFVYVAINEYFKNFFKHNFYKKRK